MEYSAEKILERAGIKPTPNRLLVLRALAEAAEPLGLPELEQTLLTLEKSSIFRVLNLFLAHHIVHTIVDGRGVAKYEVCRSSDHHSDDDLHPHFYCELCRRTICLPELRIPQLHLPEGYEMTAVNYVVKGICPDCARKN